MRLFARRHDESRSSAERTRVGQRGLHVAVYGDIDLNFLDGSSVWLSSAAHTLAYHPDIRISLLLKAEPRRDLLTGPLGKLAGLELIRPSDMGLHGRLDPTKAVAGLEMLDEHEHVDRFILRGFSLCTHAAKSDVLEGRMWSYLTDIPQSPEALTPQALTELEQITKSSEYLLCQTEMLRGFLETHVEESRRKTVLLPPMIPCPPRKGRRNRRKLRRIVYAGKFAPDWGTQEMLEVFSLFRKRHPDLELHVFGDKIHDPPDDRGFKPAMTRALQNTSGVVWHAALPRDEVQSWLTRCDLAWGWRNPSLDDSLELSTKLLEYAAAGLPIVTNRNQSNESLLGPAYPLYAQSTDDALRLLEEAVGDPALLEEARTMGMRRCGEFTFDRVYDTHLRPFLQRAEGRRGLSRRPRRILVAGHDLRFITDIVAQLQRDGHTVMLDKWRGHMSHDVQESKKLLAKADLVICEWCLGNAVWYTRHVSSEQDLIIRLHLQELQTRHPGKVDFDRVQRVVFVGPYLLEQASTATGWAPERLVTIPNYVDVAQFDRAKIGEHTFNLGMVGCSPARKRLDLALDILERLRARDRRFTLFVKGKLPWDYDWLWKRRNEREYYERTFERIRRSPLLRDSVVFDSYGDDVAAWFRKIGFLLSPSDFESFHVAIVEGGASRSVPVVLAWKGAERLYPREWIHCRPDDAARRILQVVAEGSHARIGDECHEYVAERFSVERVMDQWRDLVDDPRSFRGGG